MKVKCPVCGNEKITPNVNRHIKLHRDGIGRLCPATGKPWAIVRDELSAL